MMPKIKLLAPRNVFGKRVDAETILEVGTEIPEWQANKLKHLGHAKDYKPRAKTKKKTSLARKVINKLTRKKKKN